MHEADKNPKSSLGRSLFLLLLLCVALGGSFLGARAWRRGGSASATPSAGSTSTGQPIESTLYPTGDYLVAYVIVSSECGFCTERHTEEAVAAMRDSLRASQGKRFANVSVVGVSLDDNIAAGLKYLNALNSRLQAFDQLSVGGSWLNEFATTLVWRDEVASAEIPQVVLVDRRIDARNFPRFIDVKRDSLLLKVTGRDSIIAWVAGGAHLNQAGSRSTK